MLPTKKKILTAGQLILSIAVFLSLLLYIQLRMSVELRDPDVWLHLKTGQYILENKTIPHTDIFTSTAFGKDWLDHSWLLQVIYYLVFKFGGADNLIRVSAFTVALSFLLLFFSAYKKQYLTVTFVALTLAVLASQSRFNLRTENFSILFFSIFLYILNKGIRSRAVFLLPVIQLIWVNCHGFFIIGPCVMGIFLLAESLKKQKDNSLDTASYRNLLFAFLAVCLACFLNPYGYKTVLYPLRVIFDAAQANNIFYSNIMELLPPWRLNQRMFVFYYFLIIVSALAFLWRLKKTNPVYLILWLIFLGISLKAARNVFYFNVVAFFSIMDNFLKKIGADKKESTQAVSSNKAYLLNYISLICILLAFYQKNTDLMNLRYYNFGDYRFKSKLLGVSTDEFPEKAADFVLRNNLPQNIFNLFNHGSYFIYRFYPSKRVFIDGRTELFGDEFYAGFKKILEADEHLVRGLFKKYNIQTAIIDSSSPEIARLAPLLFDSREWALVYIGADGIIFLRNIDTNKDLIDKLAVDFTAWQVMKADVEKIGLANVNPIPHTKLAWILYALKLDELALKQAKEALKVTPTNPETYHVMGSVYLRQQQFDKAYEAFRLAYLFSPRHKGTLLGLGKVYLETGKKEMAVKIYRKFNRLYPNSPDGYAAIGNYYGQENKLLLAIQNMRAALKTNPFRVDYYIGLGELLVKNNNFEEAVKIYNKAITCGFSPDVFSDLINATRQKQLKH